MNTAIGLIETKGLVGAIEAIDASLKAANVKLLRKEKSTGGWVMVVMTGDVGSVKAAVDAGSAAAERMGQLVASHVIPRLSTEVYPLVEALPLEKAAEKSEKHLIDDYEHYKVVDLRHLARMLEISTMDRNKIKYANKEQLIEAIRKQHQGGDNT